MLFRARPQQRVTKNETSFSEQNDYFNDQYLKTDMDQDLDSYLKVSQY